MLASISRGALPVAPGARQQRPVRRVVAASWPAAALGSRSSVAARLAHQLQQLKQFKVCQGIWVVLARLGALASRKCSPTPSPRLLHAHPLKRWFCMPLACLIPPVCHRLCRSGTCRHHPPSVARLRHAAGASCALPARGPPMMAALARAPEAAAARALCGSGETCACTTTRP